MNKEQQRKEFEEWASSNTTINLDLELDLELDSDDGINHYWDISTYAAWEAWQAASDQLSKVTEQRDRLAEAVNAATILIAAKGRHNTMLAYNGLRQALLTTNHFADADNMVETQDHFTDLDRMIENADVDARRDKTPNPSDG